MVDQLEHRRIIERTALGRTVLGRKPNLTPHQTRDARARIEAGETQRSVPRTYNAGQTMISRLRTRARHRPNHRGI